MNMGIFNVIFFSLVDAFYKNLFVGLKNGRTHSFVKNILINKMNKVSQ